MQTALFQRYFFREALHAEYTSRLARNSAYSIRSYALSLGINSGALSQILSGKRRISLKLAQRILSHLSLSLDDRHHFLRSIGEEQEKLGLKKKSRVLKALLKQEVSPQDIAPERTHLISSQEFQFLSEWQNYAILEMTFIRGMELTPEAIATHLKITSGLAEASLQKLVKNGYLKPVGSGKYRKFKSRITTAGKEFTSAAHRHRQKQVLELSIASLFRDSVEIRNHSAMTIAINPKQIPEAKRRIEKFLIELTDVLEKGTQKEVYELQINLFPLKNGGAL